MPQDIAHDLKDPFAPRSGRHLVWKDVNMTVKSRPNNEEKQTFILKNIWGEVPPKQLTAIMG